MGGSTWYQKDNFFIFFNSNSHLWELRQEEAARNYIMANSAVYYVCPGPETPVDKVWTAEGSSFPSQIVKHSALIDSVPKFTLVENSPKAGGKDDPGALGRRLASAAPASR